MVEASVSSHRGGVILKEVQAKAFEVQMLLEMFCLVITVSNY